MYHRIRGRDKAPGSSSTEAPPSKEDILSTMDQFGGSSSSASTGASAMQQHHHHHQQQHGDMVIIDNPLQSPDADLKEYESQSTSFSHSYCAEWERLFDKEDYHRTLKRLGLKGMLRSCRFRSICWKLYLEVLPENRTKWLDETKQWRKKYDDLKQQLIVNPREEEKSDLALNNPLSQEVESPWNQFFLDNELRLTIKQDVIRTFPELEFFQNTEMQEKLESILLCYAKQNSILYKQGMHELLAPLIFVLHCDHQAFLHACEIESVENTVKSLLDPYYIEHDAYAMFCQVMETVEPWYLSKEIYPKMPTAAEMYDLKPFEKPPEPRPSNVIVNKLTRIQDYVLKRYDEDLHAHLEQMEIQPQIYGIRWVRLLFGREFPMQDLLVIWDAIFADGISFDLVDYIFVAMLIYIRELLMVTDYPTCMQSLMRFPPVGDCHYFIQQALYLREPNQQPRPQTYVYQKMPLGAASKASDKNSNKVSASNLANKFMYSNVVSGLSTLTRKINAASSSRPRSLHVRGGSQKARSMPSTPRKMPTSSSDPINLLTDEYSPGCSPDYEAGDDRRASTQSLSQLERTNILQGSSSASSNKKRAEPAAPQASSSSRSASSLSKLDQLSPEERANKPPHYATLPKKHRGARQQRKSAQPSKQEAEFLQDIQFLQGKLNDADAMCRYCSNKMDVHIAKLQSELLRQDLANEDELLLAIAGIKQVRDILKGTLKFSLNLLDDDEIEIADDHYKEGRGTRSAPISTDSSPDQDQGQGQPGNFYCSNGETPTTTTDSPSSSDPKESPTEGQRSRSRSFEPMTLQGDDPVTTSQKNSRRKRQGSRGSESDTFQTSDSVNQNVSPFNKKNDNDKKDFSLFSGKIQLPRL